MSEEAVVHYDQNQMHSVTDFKKVLVSNYKNQLEAQLGDEKSAKQFMANAISIIQQTPELLECEPATVFNGLLMMASLGFMPSTVSGEAYLIPRKNGKTGTKQAQFQIGYQGIVTLLYSADIQSVDGAIVYEKDGFELVNKEIKHTVNPLLKKADRGKKIGAYTKVKYRGEWTYHFMNGEDIEAHGKKFSQSYSSKFSPWQNDPEGWMWLKTVLKQHSKLLPKNPKLQRAIAEDNKDSVIHERAEKAMVEAKSIEMGNLEISHGETSKDSGQSEAEAEPTTDSHEDQNEGQEHN